MATADYFHLVKTLSEGGIRTLSEDVELIAETGRPKAIVVISDGEDTDSEAARFDRFSELVHQAAPGEIVQLIDAETGRVVAEEIRGN